MTTIKTWQERMPEPTWEKYCNMGCSPYRPHLCDDCGSKKVYGDPIAARDSEIADLRTALAAALVAAVPEGYWLAPNEPTDEMLYAGDRHMDGVSNLGDAYEAMRLVANAGAPSTNTGEHA